jgi:hypothetical protein
MSLYQNHNESKHDYGPIALTILLVALAVRGWRKVAMAGSAIAYGLWYQHAARIAAHSAESVSEVMNAQIEAFADAAGAWAVAHPDIAMALLPVLLTVYLARKWAMLEPFLLAWFEAPLKHKAIQLGGLAAMGAFYWWALSEGYVETAGAY